MTNVLRWEPGPAIPQLAANQVHVWSVWLDVPDVIVQLSAYLSQDESDRASRFLAERHRHRFIVSHARQREILARYLGCTAARIRFRFDGLGKPHLDGPFSNSQLRFNLSHSGDVALIAVALDIDIGIDVERVREMSNLEEFSQRYFSTQECEQLALLSAAERRTAFFHCWTRKEAILKATGKGLTLPLDQFVVSVHPGEPATVLSAAGEPQRANDWWLATLDPAPGYVGAVAGKCSVPRLYCWNAAEDQVS